MGSYKRFQHECEMKNAFCRNGGSDETNKQKCGMKVRIIKFSRENHKKCLGKW